VCGRRPDLQTGKLGWCWPIRELGSAGRSTTELMLPTCELGSAGRSTSELMLPTCELGSAGRSTTELMLTDLQAGLVQADRVAVAGLQIREC
jgi:hypothetical protein